MARRIWACWILQLSLVQFYCGRVGADAPPPGAAAALASPAAGKAAPAACGQRKAALKGDILVLSVGTMRPAFGDSLPEASDPGGCCRACQETDGCAAWSFCTLDGGCGEKGACDGYLSALRKRSGGSSSSSGGGGGGSSSGSSSGGSSVVQRYPVKGFGPHNERINTCTYAGRWPGLTCTLRSGDPGKMEAVKGAAAEGWVSGVVPKSPVPNCPSGFTAATCSACLASKSPSDCFSCLQRPRAYGAASGAVQACAACAGLQDGKLRGTCAACVSDFGPGAGCATCLLPASGSGGGGSSGGSGSGGGGSGGMFDLEQSGRCFKCVSDAGAEVRGGTTCTECFVSRSGADVDSNGCLACAADRSKPPTTRAGCGACHDASVRDRAGCLRCTAARGVDSADKAAACGGCSRAGMQPVTEQCYRCLSTIGKGQPYMCANLGQLPGRTLPTDTVGLAPKYYGCLAATGRLPSGANDCSACLAVPRYSYAERCMACRATSARPSGSWCAQCWHPGKPPEAAQACERCLARTTYELGFTDCVFGGNQPRE